MHIEEQQGTNFSTLSSVSEDAMETAILDGIKKAETPAAPTPAAAASTAGTDFTKSIPAAAPAAAAAAGAEKAAEQLAAEEAAKLKEQDVVKQQQEDTIAAEKATKFEAAQKAHDDAIKVAISDEEKKTIADKLIADKAAIETEYKTPEPAPVGFKVPGAENVSGEEPAGWMNLAKEQGLPDLESDTFEEYQVKLDSHYKAKYEPDLGKYTPQAQQLIEYLNADPENTPDSFMQPLKPILELKALSPVQLIEKNLAAQAFTPEEIEKQLEDWTERGMIDLEDKKIRNSLNKLEEVKRNEIVQNALRAKERSDNYAKVSEAKLIEGVKSSLAAELDFLGIPITKDVIQFFNNKLDKGEYANELKNPMLIAKGLLVKELGKQALQIITSTAKEPYMDEAKKKLHNIPADVHKAPGAGAGTKTSSTTGDAPAEGNWKVLNDFEQNFNGQINYIN